MLRTHPDWRIVLTLGAAVFGGWLVGCATLEGGRHYVEGTHALDRGEVELAVSELERAAELTPRASEVHNHLGLAYAAAGRNDDMLRAFRRAVELDCANESARHNLNLAEAGEGEVSVPR